MKLDKYTEFLIEQQILLILETNIVYTDNFKKTLSKIESPISTQILSLSGKDIDVNTNYIDITEKEDTITFIPSNRFDPNDLNKIIVTDPGEYYSDLDKLVKIIGLPLSTKWSKPNIGDTGTIIREFTSEEIQQIYNTSYSNSIFYIKLDNGNNLFIRDSGISKASPKIRSNELKIGRFVKKILTASKINISDKEIEEFVNKYKSQIHIQNDIFSKIEIVSKDEIKYWYHFDRYDTGAGTLNNSCMRYQKCQNFLDIYTNNPEVCQLVILKNDTGDKIKGRALLWKVKDENNEDCGYFMDRVYCTTDSYIELFKQYAVKNGWMYKSIQDSNENTTILKNNSISDNQKFMVYVNDNYSKYPYMDTIKYFDTSENLLSNDSSIRYDYELESTEGGNGNCDCCDGSGNVECEECRGNGEIPCSTCDGDREVNCDECNDGKVSCSTCDGDGEITNDDGNTEECPDCDGSGETNCDECKGDGNIECTDCNGSGEEECPDCDGRGRVDCDECN